MTKPKKKAMKHYAELFKIEAARRVIDGGERSSHVDADLGVTSTAAWVRAYKAGKIGKNMTVETTPSPSSEFTIEIASLKHENIKLKKVIELLMEH